jgi:hypothetical protein
MHFSRIDDFYAVSRTVRITGPRHNLLQLRMEEGGERTPVIECLPPIGSCIHAPLDPEKLAASVVDAINSANHEFGTNYVVTHIRYVANDTPPEAVYGFLAREIVRHLASGGFG